MLTEQEQIQKVTDRILKVKQRDESAIAEAKAREEQTYRELVKQWAIVDDSDLHNGDALIEFLRSSGRSYEDFLEDVRAKASIAGVVFDPKRREQINSEWKRRFSSSPTLEKSV